MGDTVSHSSLIREARAEIRGLKNPGIRPDAWRSITDLLAAIAGYLPDCFPSERLLAKKLGKHHQNVHRLIVRARDLGLLTTTPRPLEKSYRDGQTYRLVCLSEGLQAAVSRHHFQASSDARRKISYSVGDQDEATFSEGGISRACGPEETGTPRSNVMPFNRPRDPDWEGPVIGEDPSGPVTAPTVLSTDPAVYLARRFDRKWAQMSARHTEYRPIRSSLRPRATGYITRMIEDNGLSPEHIEAYMDAFVAAVGSGDVEIKEGQNAFQRFTGWWGTVEVDDPAMRASADATRKDIIEAYRRGLTNG